MLHMAASATRARSSARAACRSIGLRTVFAELVGQLLCFRELEGALVNGPARDGADNALLLDCTQRPDIFEIRDPAAGDYRDRQRSGQLESGFHVEPGQHAVATDIRMDDRLHPIFLKSFSEIDHIVPSKLGPA